MESLFCDWLVSDFKKDYITAIINYEKVHKVSLKLNIEFTRLKRMIDYCIEGIGNQEAKYCQFWEQSLDESFNLKDIKN